MGLKVYIDGNLVDKEEAKISVFDHGVLYGDGVFEGIRLYEGCIFRLVQHVERLFESAHHIMLSIPMSKEEVIRAVVDTCKANKLENGYIRLVVTRGEGTLGLSPWLCPKPTVFIIADKIQIYPDEYYENGLELVTVPTLRNFPEVLNPRIKSLNYLNNIMAKIEAHNAGAFEALMLNKEGFVAECTGDNVFIVHNSIIYTPPIYMGALRGITRDYVIEISHKLGYELCEEPFTRFEVFNADECFLTGTAAEVIPVVKVDQRVIGTGKPGPITRRLIEEFRKATAIDGVKIN